MFNIGHSRKSALNSAYHAKESDKFTRKVIVCFAILDAGKPLWN